MLFKETDSLAAIWDTVRRELHRGAGDSKHPFHFVTMATLSAKQPDTRYVVLRQLDENLCFHIFTDSRSHKVNQLILNPAVTLLFYHSRKRCQVKVQGTATIHQRDSLSKRHWEKVQGEAQKAYQGMVTPGKEVANPTDAHVWEEEKGDAYFTVVAIQPFSIECLQLDGLRHLRNRFYKEGDEWKGIWLAP
ncbi:pyridoxamine 5'-phosphate oxidase family protein [Cyclobacterium jeungdonense]|uniref:Pyridoxamine 5'-phosphate oxidase family protein n=1 Tax=Cyclobacterium jeungdonense TaxID=708087 RepID=A0ABT8CBN1_9BACT|nr:pyridoxamine 5'-phosphate oxidase family protein [Cyclobacterium jeungdonense]MDN3688993.1 pyridoxamine 5'-phosphate oxidase family protein [Cyclobacterium jeungdonense]